MNCIVIDDEPIARIGMEDLIATVEDLKLLTMFKSTAGVKQYLIDNNVDLLFLDIHMPGINGLEFATSIPESTLVIFTTAYPQYALQSYELNAVDYLVKPIDTIRFRKAIEKARSYWMLVKSYNASVENVSQDYITVRVDRRNLKLFYNDINYIGALKDYVFIYTSDKRIITWMNLKTIHAKLPQDQFLRVSKSYVVNQFAITAYNNSTVYVGDTEISIGNAYRGVFFRKYRGSAR